ncbi:NSS family neurotransmitter:Na+ symporter [Desulfohalotomaculum tongense]|nr:sodium-dependent transporter [Desulforadius tongensis]MBM7854596.1 NSS family neurotransmitter:Na+ symporter [Desulforadius tongensis]
MQKQEVKREGFGTSLGVIAATLGSAVGLGNIWKFPYMTGENGGAAFIFVYLISTFLVGLPVMISEFIIGRRANRAAVGSFKKLAPGRPWYFTGIAGMVSAILIMAFYTTVAGWVFAYAFKAITGSLNVTDAESAKQAFNSLAGSVWTPLIWQWLVLALASTIIIGGVRGGIERITKTLLPILFVLLLVCDIRALTLSGASEGLKFLFQPDFSKITGVTVLMALGLSFFKLSVGVGTMTTYGSYIGKNESLPGTAVKVMFSDIIVSILAGIAIFPAVFSFGLEPESGPPLLFFTIPMVFNAMPLGQVFLALFFILTSIATIGAMLSLLEVPVSYLHEEKNWNRKTATAASALVIAALGSTATLSSSVLADFKLFDKSMFDLMDFMSSNILMPAAGIFIALFAGYKLGPRVVYDEATNRGRLANRFFVSIYLFIVRFIAPLAIIIVLLSGLGIIKL